MDILGSYAQYITPRHDMILLHCIPM